MMQIRQFDRQDEADVIALWHLCGLTRPWNDPARDIERKLQVDDSLFSVGTVDGHVIATIMGGYDGHRGWVNYLAVHPGWRGRGFGRQLMTTLEQQLLSQGCPKLNLQVRTDNVEALNFYDSIGYSVDQVISLGKRLIVDN